MAPKKVKKAIKKESDKPRKRFKYIKIVEKVDDPYNLN